MRTLPLIVLVACSDYELNPHTDPVVPPTGECNLIGEAAATVDLDATCQGQGAIDVVDPWDLSVEWNYSTPSGDTGVIVMPAVGNLTDDNSDGLINELDDPDVAFVTWGFGTLVALNGTDGSVIFERPGYWGQAGVTIADVDNDGEPEIIALTSGYQVAAVDGTGAQKWLSEGFPSTMQMYPQPTVADLYNNGDVEVIFDDVIVDGRTGATRATLAGVANSWRTPIAADLDQDGVREIILGNQVFRPDGTVKWSNPGFGAGNFAAVANIDDDDGGEVFFVSGSELFIHDDDGTLLRQITITGTNPGPPAIADFDGDGQVEIAIPANYNISLYKIDGTNVWNAPMQDSSGLAGCSGYDVNGDGAYEVLFADETDLRIYDGKTGAVVYDDPTHDSATVWEYPVIADADNDGSAEILVASNSFGYSTGARGVTMFGHNGSGWPKSGPTWPTHDFAVTNVLPDGSVPTNETPSWLVNNTFRARPAMDEPGVADLFVEVGDPCLTTCSAGGRVQIPWQIGNRGGARTPSGLAVALYAIRSDGEHEIASTTIDGIAPGDVLHGAVFDVAVEDVAGSDGIIVRADANNVVTDCHPADDDVSTALAICGP